MRPTAPDAVPIPRLRLARAFRRAYIAALTGFLILAATGSFGVRTRMASASGGGYKLELEYTSITRPGLASPWSVDVRRPGGFDGPVTIAVDAGYFERFDENAVDPDPSSSTSSATATIWQFDPPPGDVLRVSVDTRLEPGVQSSFDG